MRAYHCLRHLAQHNHVTVAAPVRDAAEAEAVAALEREGVEVIAGPLKPMRAAVQSLANTARAAPISMGYFRAPSVVRRVRHHCRHTSPDLAIVHCSSVAPYVLPFNGPKVLDFVDMDSAKWRLYSDHQRWPKSWGYRWEGRNLARAEARLARAFDLSLTATAFEQQTLADLAGPVASAVVRNGVDLEFFAPGPADGYDPDHVCFVGRMDYYPNEQAMVRFCAETWPLIRSRRPLARLSIVGAAPGPAVRALADHPGVAVTGTVDDVRPYVRSAACTVVPLAIARGTQNKILESLAMAVPVVASPVAARGVDADPHTHLRIAETPAALAEAVGQLMDRPDQRGRLAQAGRSLVEARYDWRTTLADFDAALAHMLARRSGDRAAG